MECVFFRFRLCSNVRLFQKPLQRAARFFICQSLCLEETLQAVGLLASPYISSIGENTVVVNALFGGSIGFTKDTKRNLEQRGAIFGDRPGVLNPK